MKGGLAPPAWDCWGCVRHVLEHHAGIVLPFDPTRLDRRDWRMVAGRPQAFDIAEMRLTGAHAGLFVTPSLILHCAEATGTVCVAPGQLLSPVLAVWRHASRA